LDVAGLKPTEVKLPTQRTAGFRPRQRGPISVPVFTMSASISRSSTSLALRSALACGVSSPCW
jgi:hypothetical protein